MLLKQSAESPRSARRDGHNGARRGGSNRGIHQEDPIVATAPPVSGPRGERIRNHAAFIWSVADLLRGDYKQSEYGKVILPLTVIRRLRFRPQPSPSLGRVR